MIDQFNQASLAKLPRQELLSLLARYQSKLCAASTENERAKYASRIAVIHAALAIK